MDASIVTPASALDGLATLRAAAAGGGPADWVRLAEALRACEAPAADEAYDLYRRAAEAGHAAGQIEHGRMLMHGVGCVADPFAAVHWFERAESAGHAVAGYFLALLALGSVVLPRDGRINQRVLAAVQANFPPAIRAAAVHFGRRSHPRDQDICLRLLAHATNLGDAVAAQLLVERLDRGEGCQAQPGPASGLRAQLAAAGVGTLPAVTAPIPPAVYPLRESGLVPPGMLALEDALQPAPVQVLSQAPRVMRIDDLLSADECRLLIACAAPNLRQSRALDPTPGDAVPAASHTGNAARLGPAEEDLALRLVQLRIARSARTELTHAEHLVVSRYRPGDEYRPRRDDLPADSLPDDRPQAGNRARTICVYLNDVEAGGETDFPLAGVRVAPRAGHAVVFDNLHPDGRPDEASLHAGLPVERGEKWLATLWLRERRYRQY